MTTVSKDQLRKFLDGHCDADEEAQVRRYLETPEGQHALDKMMDDSWGISEEIPAKQKVFSNILKKTTRAKKHRINRAFYYKIAAIFIILTIPAYLLFNRAPEAPPITKPDWLVKSNDKGQKSVIQLSDGSKVYLNSESTIKYLRYFSDSLRHIELDGEAYFKVAKDKSRPFIVTAQGYSTTALGTEFNVKSRGGDYLVSLAEGSIVINPESEAQRGIKLVPGEALKIDTTNKTVSKQAGTLSDFLWKDGILDFEVATMKEVIASLERWYGVKIETKGKVTSKKYTGRFDNASLEHVLQSMSFALDFEYEMNKKQITLTF